MGAEQEKKGVLELTRQTQIFQVSRKLGRAGTLAGILRDKTMNDISMYIQMIKHKITPSVDYN